MKTIPLQCLAAPLFLLRPSRAYFATARCRSSPDPSLRVRRDATSTRPIRLSGRACRMTADTHSVALAATGHPSPVPTDEEASPGERRHYSYDDTFSVGGSRRDVLLRSCAAATVTLVAAAAAGGGSPAHAISADEASSSYDRYASSYDALDGGTAASALGIDEARTRLLRSATGRVLEVGVGTGLNIDRYRLGEGDGGGGGDGGVVTSLTLCDISEGMLAEARAKVEGLNVPAVGAKVEFVRADATSSQLVEMFGRESFDTVVDTFSLCVMGSEGAKNCLRQMAEVVKRREDGGRILLIENARSSSPLLGWYQDVTAETAAKAGGKGCVYNQDVTAMIRSTPGLRIESEVAFSAGLFRSYSITKA